MTQELSFPPPGAKARWPASMKWAAALGAFPLLGLVVVALWLINQDLTNWGGYLFGLGFIFGLFCLLPAVALGIPYGFMVARFSVGRIAYTVVAALLLFTCIAGFAALGPDRMLAAVPMPLVMSATASAVLTWLPQSKPFFSRR